MAVEIACQSRQFGTQMENRSFTDFLSSARTISKYRELLSKDVKVGIFYNYIHDLESLWWIIVWMTLLYKASPFSTDKESHDRIDKQREYYYRLFPGDMSVDERLKFLTEDETYTEFIQFIPRDFLNQVLLIECFREVIVYFYTNAEASTPSSEPIRFPDTDRPHDAILFQIPDFEFEEMEVMLYGRWRLTSLYRDISSKTCPGSSPVRNTPSNSSAVLLRKRSLSLDLGLPSSFM